MEKNVLGRFIEAHWLGVIVSYTEKIKQPHKQEVLPEELNQEIVNYLNKKIKKTNLIIKQTKLCNYKGASLYIKILCNEKDSLFLESDYREYEINGKKHISVRPFSIYHSSRMAPHNSHYCEILIDDKNYKAVLDGLIEIQSNYQFYLDNLEKKIVKQELKIKDNIKKDNQIQKLLKNNFEHFIIINNRLHILSEDKKNVVSFDFSKTPSGLKELESLKIKFNAFSALMNLYQGIDSISIR